MSDVACMKCHGSFPSHELFAVPGGRICGPCQLETETPEADSLRKHPLMVAALIGVAVPLVFKMPVTSQQTVNGVVTHFEYHDWPAVIGGATALLCGLLLAVAVLRKTLSPRKSGFLALGSVLLFGGMHVARGFGAFAQPSAGASEAALSDSQP